MTSNYDSKGNRVAPYVEDSTKGSSLISPLNYKGDVLVQVWVDSRVLATLSRWMDLTGCSPRFLSEVVRRPLEVLAAHLVDSGQAEMVDDTVAARLLLEVKFRVNLNRGNRGGKNILHNQVLSDSRDELAEKMRRGNRFNDAQVPSDKPNQGECRITEEEWQRAKRENQMAEYERRKKEKEAAISNAKAAGMIVKDEPSLSIKREGEVLLNEPGTLIPTDDPRKPGEGFKEGMTAEEFEKYSKAREDEIRARENAPVDIEWLKKNRSI